MNPPDSTACFAEATTTATAAPVTPESAGEFDPLAAAGVRYEWYRDGFRLLLALLLVQGAVLALSLGLNVHLYAYQPPPKVLVQLPDGRIVGVEPLDGPAFSDERVAQWATEAVIAANSWTWADYREALQRACNTYFTPNGCEEYRDALIKIGNLESVKTKRLVVRAVVVKPPLILNKVIQGQTQRFTWHLQLEIMMSWLSSAEQTAQNLIVNLVVIRRPLTEYQQGLGIEKYVAAAGRGR